MKTCPSPNLSHKGRGRLWFGGYFMEIISAKYLLTMDGDPIVDGAIAVENGEILDVATEEKLLERYSNALHEDHPQHVLMPGLINAHTHLDMTHHKNYPFDPVRSTAVEVSFVDWLISTIDYKKSNGPDKLRAAVEDGISACIDAGTTCVADMGSYEGIFQSLEQSGLRGVIFPELLSYSSSSAKNLFETAMAIVEKYMDLDSDLITVGMAPYSAYLLSRNILKIMSQYCRSSNLPLIIHVAESFSEMEFFYNSTGDIATRLFPNIGWGEKLPPPYHKTPIQYLDDIDFLASQPILVGCVNATQADLDRVAKSGSKVVWTPRSNYYLKFSKTPVADIHKKGIPMALGTEGISSTNTLSLWDELRFAYETISPKEGGINARELLQMVTCNAARVLGLQEEIGCLKRGMKADYLVVDVSDFSNKGDLYTYLIQKTKNYHVHKVVVNGQTLKSLN